MVQKLNQQYEENNPTKLIKDLYSFLNIDTNFIPKFDVLNKTGVGLKSSFLQRILFRNISLQSSIRRFFIDKIISEAPHYKHLHKVQPGITSWGQVKYGYAENVNEMVQRLKYDMLYIKNQSLSLDFKILLYTVIIVLKRKGK